MNWKKWIGPLLGLFFLGLVVLNPNLRELFSGIIHGNPRKIFNPELHIGQIYRHFMDADYRILLLATALSMVQYPLRAIRWKYLLLPRKKIKFHSLLSATMIGFMANNLLPARLGEFVRAYMISRKEQISKSSAMATIVLERIFDGLALLAILLFVFHSFSFPGWVVVIGWWATGIFAFVFAFLVSMTLWPNGFAGAISSIGTLFSQRVKKRAESLILRFISGLDILHDRRLVLITLVLSLIHWLFLGWCLGIALDSFHIELPRTGPYFVLSIVALGLSIPSSPAFIGTFQWLTERALAVYEVPKDLSLSFSSVFLLTSFIPTTLIGIIYFLKEHLTWKELRRTEEEIKQNSPAAGGSDEKPGS